jgi:uncharacterized protein
MTFLESISREDLIRFCRRWQVRELALFGSALRPDFRPESDVDVLISFHERANWGLFDHVQMQLDLEGIFKRKVGLVTRRALEQTQNGLLREQILKTAKVIFAGDEVGAIVRLLDRQFCHPDSERCVVHRALGVSLRVSFRWNKIDIPIKSKLTFFSKPGRNLR